MRGQTGKGIFARQFLLNFLGCQQVGIACLFTSGSEKEPSRGKFRSQDSFKSTWTVNPNPSLSLSSELPRPKTCSTPVSALWKWAISYLVVSFWRHGEHLMAYWVLQRLCLARNTLLKPPLATRCHSSSKSSRVKTVRLPSCCSKGPTAMGFRSLLALCGTIHSPVPLHRTLLWQQAGWKQACFLFFRSWGVGMMR